jgi:hypothetical protein
VVEQAFLSAKPSLFGGVLWPAFTRLVGVKFGAAGVPQTPPSVSLSLTSRCGASPVSAKAFIVEPCRIIIRAWVGSEGQTYDGKGETLRPFSRPPRRARTDPTRLASEAAKSRHQRSGRAVVLMVPG